MPLPPLGVRRKPGVVPRAAAPAAAPVEGAPAPAGATASGGADAGGQATAAGDRTHQQSLAVDRLLLGCVTAFLLDLVYVCITARSVLSGFFAWVMHVLSFVTALHRLWFVLKTYRSFLAGSLPAGSASFLDGALHVSALASYTGWVRPLPLVHRVTMLLTRGFTLLHVLAAGSRWLPLRTAGVDGGALPAASSGNGALTRLVGDLAATTTFVVFCELVRGRRVYPCPCLSLLRRLCERGGRPLARLAHH